MKLVLAPATFMRMRYSDVVAQTKSSFQSRPPQPMLPTTSGTVMIPRNSAEGLMTQMPVGP